MTTETPIIDKMIFHEAPGAGFDAHQIWNKGIAGWGDIDLNNFRPPELPENETISIDEARRHSFQFIELWGRRAQAENDNSLNPIASLSHFQPGLGMVNSDKIESFRNAVTQTFLDGLDETEYLELNFGPRKRILLIESDLTPDEMYQRLLEAPNQPYQELFPNLAIAQQTIQERRRNAGSIFAEVFNGKTDGLTRPYQEIENEEDAEQFEWGWMEEEGELTAINCDFNKQTLRSLAEGATLKETGQMLNIVDKFMKGKRGRNRFVIQIDNGQDAVCCNTAFNSAALYNKTETFVSSSKLLQKQTNELFSSLVSRPKSLGGIHYHSLEKSNSTCNSCGKEKYGDEKERCNCSNKNTEQKNQKKSN